MIAKWVWLFGVFFLWHVAVLAQPARPFPAQDSPVRKTAAKYRFSMNMLLFPDYFMSEDQFQTLVKDQFKDSNLPAVVKGLKEYGYKADMPQSAREYREKIYPLMLKCLKDTGYAAVEIPVNGAVLELCPALKEEIARQGLAVTAVGMAGEDLQASLK